MKQAVQEITENGFYKFDFAIESHKIYELVNNITGEYFNDGGGGKHKFSEINKPGRYSLGLEQLGKYDSILEVGVCREFLAIAEDYLKCAPTFSTCSFTVGGPVNAAEMDKNAQFYHRDKDRLKFLKFFIYLTNVTEEHGLMN